jgi:peptide-methionine (S)-S-oxide reductase
LLEIFWHSHDPTGWQEARQYLRAVFYHDERQQALALASKKAVEKPTDGKVLTRVLPLHSFTLAEDYHQKYLLKSHIELARELIRIYPRNEDFVDSTAAARLNGYAGGYGNRQQLGREIDQLGLGQRGRGLLEHLVQSRGSLN